MTHENTHNKAHSKTAIVPSKPKKGLKNLLKKAFVPMLFLGIMAMAVLSQPQPQKDDQKVPSQKKPVEEIRPSGTSDIPHEAPAKIDTTDVPAVEKCAPQRPSWTIRYIIVAAITAAIIAVYVASVDWKPIPKKKIKVDSQVKLNVSLTESNPYIHVKPSQSLEDMQKKAPSGYVTQGILDVKKEEVKHINGDVNKWMSEAEKGNLAYLKSQSDKIDIEAKDNWGNTALIISAGRGYLDIVQYLVKKKANIEAKNNYGETALIISAGRGYLDCVKSLCQEGANIEAKNKYGDTALIHSAIFGELACMRYLVEQGADINASNEDGDTALIWSAVKDDLACVKYLVEQGADINVENKYEETALTWAKSGSDCLKYLEKKKKEDLKKRLREWNANK